MICNKCGKEIPQSMVMCPNCGTIVESYDLDLGDSLNSVNVLGSGSSMNLQNGMNQPTTSGMGVSPQVQPVQGVTMGDYQQPAMVTQQTPNFDNIFGVDELGASGVAKKEKARDKGGSFLSGDKPRLVSEMDSFGRRIKTDHVGVAIIFCALLTVLGMLLPVFSDKSSAIIETRYIMFGFGIGKISALAAVLCVVFKMMRLELPALASGFFSACLCLLSVTTAKETIAKGNETLKNFLSIEMGYYLLVAAGVAMLLVQAYNFLVFIGKISYDED